MFEKTKAFFKNVKEKLSKTSDSLTSSITEVFKVRVKVDEKVLENLQENLILSDVSYSSSEKIISNFRNTIKNIESEQEVTEGFYLSFLQKEIQSMLARDDLSISLDAPDIAVIMISGVNGSGKTTTIGKLANIISKEKKVMIVAADTFRAAAIDQLEVWSKRVGVDFFYSDNKDPASVVFSSIDKAKAIQSDVIIIDTAGRLGNNEDLMNELSKIEKVIEKQNNVTLVDNLIVLDGTSGQNALSQIDKFKSRINLSGVVITKLDSTSKAGFAISASYDYDLPIKLIGIGEGINDLQPFDPEDFSKALLGLD
ncbi:MAG: signal recognition particle-docking protein FtsY [Thermodesulfobacteriota bacterium]|nr:signal recognition particle-docking protein FtsY [Deltaproteobacteria bacterium TMED58]RZP15210.1 MAG: signal recognition particle-docking protein FtsY [Candidatus Dadabacteria bacterium]|tara:strand:+ start:20158 stop:21093 length:936 start_codon:yes stop_codon:yes gene_type:complete